MRTFTRLTAVAAGGALVFAMGISAVSAASTEAYGSYTYNYWNVNNTYDGVGNTDTANDGQFTSARWRYTGGLEGTELVNKKGPGQTVTMTATYAPTRVTQILSCRSRTLLPMICGDWKSTGR